MKRNEQVDHADPLPADMQDHLIDRLLANRLFRMATRPHVVRPSLFSRYELLFDLETARHALFGRLGKNA